MNIRSLVSRWKFPAAIVLAAVILAVTSYWNDSLIVDEVPHIGAGYSYIVKQDMHLNPEHPPLAKDLAGIALAFLNINQTAFTGHQWTSDINGQWEFGRSLIYLTGNNADLIGRVARFPMLIFFVIAAILIFTYGRKLFGETGAAIALLLFCFSPTVLAHTRFVTTDTAAMTAVLASTLAFLQFLQHKTWRSFILASVIFGFALLAKFSTFLLVPYFVFLAMLWGWIHGRSLSGRIHSAFRWIMRSVAMLIAGFILIVLPVYILHTWNYQPQRQHNDTKYLLYSFPKRIFADPVVWASDKPILRSASWYATGLLMTLQRAGGDNTITFLGRVVQTGGPIYFPLVYLVKEPLSWWVLVFIALMITLLRLSQSHKPQWERASTWLNNNFDVFAMIAWLIFFWTISIRSRLNIGVRHILPTFPFAILLVAGQISYFIQHLKKHEARELRIFSFIIVLLLAWGIFEQARVHPAYLSYFNQLAGGPSRGREIVTDSNLDWGQDLKRLGDFVKENNIDPVQIDYFGWADLVFYLDGRYVPIHDTTYKDTRDFLQHNPNGGWIAVSTTYFEHSISRDNVLGYTWLNAYKLTAAIGNSILVWHITP